MKRRSFLKLSALTTAGAIVPFTLVKSEEIKELIKHDIAKKGNSFLFIRMLTDKGNMNFKVPAEREFIEDKIFYKSIEGLIFEPEQTVIVYDIEVFVPEFDIWIKIPYNNSYEIASKAGDRITLNFAKDIVQII